MGHLQNTSHFHATSMLITKPQSVLAHFLFFKKYYYYHLAPKYPNGNRGSYLNTDFGLRTPWLSRRKF